MHHPCQTKPQSLEALTPPKPPPNRNTRFLVKSLEHRKGLCKLDDWWNNGRLACIRRILPPKCNSCLERYFNGLDKNAATPCVPTEFCYEEKLNTVQIV